MVLNKAMKKYLVIFIFLFFDAGIYFGYLILWLRENGHPNFRNALNETVVSTILCFAIIINNVTLCFVIRYKTDCRRWYDFLLILIGIFEVLALVPLLFSRIPLLWYKVTWEDHNVLRRLFRGYHAVAILSNGCLMFASYCPAIAFCLQFYRNQISDQKLPTRAFAIPLIATTLLCFAMCFIVYGADVEDYAWIHILFFIVCYIIPSVSSLVSIAVINFKLLRSTPNGNEESNNLANSHNIIFSAFSALFILMFGPFFIGKIIYVHGDTDLFSGIADYKLFYTITVSLVLLKALLNLPLLLAADNYFYCGLMKLIGNRNTQFQRGMDSKSLLMVSSLPPRDCL